MQNNGCFFACRWLLLALLLAGPALAWAQTPAFTQAVSFNPTASTGTTFKNAIALDAAGNQYVTDNFTGMLVLGTTTLVSAGSNDIFVEAQRQHRSMALSCASRR